MTDDSVWQLICLLSIQDELKKAEFHRRQSATLTRDGDITVALTLAQRAIERKIAELTEQHDGSVLGPSARRD
jgi:hypothetical protein